VGYILSEVDIKEEKAIRKSISGIVWSNVINAILKHKMGELINSDSWFLMDKELYFYEMF
jgi:hypothetical protein